MLSTNQYKKRLRNYSHQVAVLLLLCGIADLSLAQNLNRPNKMGPLGTQVNTASGNLYLHRTDVQIPVRGLMYNLDVAFDYNSFEFNVNNGYGNGWSFTYNMRYKVDTSGAVIITRGDARQDTYTVAGTAYTAPPGIFEQLNQYQPGKFRLTTKQGLAYFFDNSQHRRLTRIADPNGNALTMSYTDSLLTGISSSAGQAVTLSYMGNKLQSVTDAIATPSRSWTYTYDAAGNLTKVTDPLGGLMQYSYLTNGPMSSITDKNMNEANIIYYPGYTVSELIGCNSRKSFSYDTTLHRTTVTDYLPNSTNQVTTYNYQYFGKQIWLTAITGNCCGYNNTYAFDAAGNITQQTDAKGNVYSYTYDSRGNLLTATDPLNHTVRYTYSSDYNHATGFTDEDGNSYTVTYDSRGNITQVAPPGTQPTQIGHASNGDLVSLTDASGNSYSFTYDANGYPTQASGPLNFSLGFAFNARGRLHTFTDTRNNQYTGQYDALDRLTTLTDPLNHNLTLSYDANSNVKTFKDPDNHVRTLAYDASDRLVTYTDALGKQRRYTYDAMDNVTGYRDKLNNASAFTYDNRNRISSFTDAAGNVYRYDYDANGNMTSITYPNGNIISTNFDALDRPLKSTDNLGNITAVQYDNRGNVTSITNSTGAVLSGTYNSRNLITRISDALGNYFSYTYDNRGNLTTITNRNNQMRRYGYDARNRLTSFTDNSGDLTRLGYDAAGNVLTITDAKSNVTSYAYDVLDRATTITYANGQYISHIYSNNGYTLSSRLTDGSSISYQYDSVGRLIKKILPGNNIYSFGYDANGRLTGATNSNGTISYLYDAIGRLRAEGFNSHTTGYSYNMAARSQTITYPDSSTIVNSFDVRNRLISLQKGATVLASIQYNNANQPVQTSFANGIVSSRQYDFANRLTNINTTGIGIQNLSFTYDKEGNVTAVGRPQNSEQYTYDGGNRLATYIKGSLQNSYNYDSIGSRTTASLNGVATTYSVNNINQYTALNSSSQHVNFTYDGNGNLTYDGLNYKTYDAENRLLSDSSAAGIILYQYDALGRRVQKSVSGRSLRYYYAGLSQIELRDALTDTVMNETVYSGMGMPLLSGNARQVYYYHPNHLNSVEAVTNAQGMLAEQYEYDDFGNTTIRNAGGSTISQSAVGNRFGFTGQEYDAETRSYHFHFRNYNPGTGSFNQKDPLGYGDGIGVYQYVHNNPGSYIDPLGLKPCPPQPPPPPQTTTFAETELYHFGNYSNGTSVLAVLENPAVSSSFIESAIQFSEKIPNNAILAIPLTAVNAINTVNSIESLSANYQTNTAGQNLDGAIGVGSGALSTGLGSFASGAYLYGAASTSTLAGGSTAVSSAFGSLVATGGAITASGGLVAAAGGLGIYGLVNEGWKAGTGMSLSESAEQDYFNVPIFTDVVKNAYSGKYTEFDDYTEQYIYHQNAGNLQQWLEARQKISQRKYQPQPSSPQDCPPHGPSGGTQNPPPPPPPTPPYSTEVISSKDPNEIIGPTGVSTPKFVSVKDNLPYLINYENSRSASAPAKTVRIIYPIDPKQDKNSFALGSFGFNNQTFSVPAGTNAYYQRLDVRDSLGLYVDVTAGLDVQNNQAFWFFQSIDPATLLPTTAPLAGFLSLQDTASLNKGHGFVNFTIKPLSTDHTGDTMHAYASIVFDGNDTIPTNYAKNTIDAVAPTSHMNSAPSVSYTNTFPLSWAGTDDAGGSGLRSYALYYSVNNGVYMLLRSGITRQDTTFTGSNGNTYRFFVLATDSTGNIEMLKSGAEVTVLVNATILPITWQSFTAVLQGKNGLLNWATGSETKSKYFAVERSVNGRSFAQIGTVAAAGYSSTRRDYRFIDSNVIELNVPLVYYRIQQVDNDGAYTYSNVVAVPLPNANLKPSVEVYPNPFRQTLNLLLVNLPSATGDNVSLYTIDGKQMYSKALGSRVASANITLDDLPQLPQGIYLLKITSGKEVFNFKLMRE